jgi:hypothetical protein
MASGYLVAVFLGYFVVRQTAKCRHQTVYASGQVLRKSSLTLLRRFGRAVSKPSRKRLGFTELLS